MLHQSLSLRGFPKPPCVHRYRAHKVALENLVMTNFDVALLRYLECCKTTHSFHEGAAPKAWSSRARAVHAISDLNEYFIDVTTHHEHSFEHALAECCRDLLVTRGARQGGFKKPRNDKLWCSITSVSWVLYFRTQTRRYQSPTSKSRIIVKFIFLYKCVKTSNLTIIRLLHQLRRAWRFFHCQND